MKPSVAIVGGGPAGLMAAEVLAAGGAEVDVFDAMPSMGRKFLMAGKGGLNLTHAEDAETFASRYGQRRDRIEPMLRSFGPQALRDWAAGLGVGTFVGSSGRIFPEQMKAAPLLRAWLHRLRSQGVRFHARHRWTGWDAASALEFTSPQGPRSHHAGAVVLALGGGSWARLGSDGAWVPLLEQKGVRIAPLRPANCGFDVGWSEVFRGKFAGEPLKSVIGSCVDAGGRVQRRQGECVITGTGIEGGLVYALSAALRDRIASTGHAELTLDLMPGYDVDRLAREIAHPRGSRSLSSHLQSRIGLKGVKAGLAREVLPGRDFEDPARLAAGLKALPLKLATTRPIDEAISTAGGVRFEDLDEHLMLRSLPGVFCAGEMLDWEAPTGGYLLTACLASGRRAAEGVLARLPA